MSSTILKTGQLQTFFHSVTFSQARAFDLKLFVTQKNNLYSVFNYIFKVKTTKVWSAVGVPHLTPREAPKRLKISGFPVQPTENFRIVVLACEGEGDLGGNHRFQGVHLSSSPHVVQRNIFFPVRLRLRLRRPEKKDISPLCFSASKVVQDVGMLAMDSGRIQGMLTLSSVDVVLCIFVFQRFVSKYYVNHNYIILLQ